MRITGLLEDRDAAAELLDSLGWLGYAIDSKGARAPPPSTGPDVPELPFTCELDGIVHEPEPWEWARQQRLERYARERDQIAGIVIYDGEGNEAPDTLVQEEVSPQATAENQTEFFPDEFDQRLPETWQEGEWDHTTEQWRHTPLAPWATGANTWDGIDPIPPEDEPVFFTD